MQRLDETIRQALRHAPRVLRCCASLILLALAGSGWALDSGTSAEDSLQLPLAPMVTPMYLEKTVNPLSLSQDTGWQLGGLNTQFDTKGNDGALSLRGGLFYSRQLGPRQVLDSNAVPNNQFGQQENGFGARTLGLPQGLLFNGTGGSAMDQVTYQRMSYQGHGLSLNGSYAQVGKNFQGLNELVQQMAPGDAQGASLLTQGMTRSNLNATYTGVRGLELTHNVNNLVNEQQGNKEYGLSRTEQEDKLVYNFGDRRSFTYRQYSKDDRWDPALAQKPGAALRQEQFGLRYGLAPKSEFSLNQSTTSTTAGAMETDTRQHSLALSWNEWQNFSFSGNYANTVTGRTNAANRALNLAVSTSLLPHVKITGNLVQNETTQPGVAEVKNNQANLNVVAQLAPTLQLSSQYSNVVAPDKGEVTTRDQQLTWAFLPRWSFTTHLLNTDNSLAGNADRVEYNLTGKLGSRAQDGQVTLSTRTDMLPNDIQQRRREVSYQRAIGSGETPTALRVQVGQYDLTQSDLSKDGNLLTVQLLTLHPLPRATMSLGYYDGPTLGANYLAYRSWGQKPSGNMGIWDPSNFVQYRETGSQLTYALTDSTNLVIKQLFGEREDTGRVDTSEYGVEQQLGPVHLLLGRRATAQTGNAADLTENWWQANWGLAKPLPAWAANSLRQTVFSDSAAWGLAQAPAWATAPAAGLTVERHREQAIANRADVYTARFARMLGPRLFLQSSYERNPRKSDKPNEIDLVERELFHLGYAVRPNLLAYVRYLRENRLDVQPDLLTRSVGIVGTLSKNEKLHLQVDLLTRTNNGEDQWGTGYMAGYERTVSADNAFSLKYRYLPEAFSTPGNAIRVEASLQHAF